MTAIPLLALLSLGCPIPDGFKGVPGSDTSDSWGNGSSDTDNDTDDDTDTDDTDDTDDPVTGTGYEVGDTAYDLVLPDQDDETWSLWDQSAGLVVLVFGGGGGGDFQAIAAWFGEVSDAWSDDGLSVSAAMVMQSDLYFTPPERSDAEDLAEMYDIPVVLWDADGICFDTWNFGTSTDTSSYVITGDMQIAWKQTYTTTREALDYEVRQLAGD